MVNDGWFDACRPDRDAREALVRAWSRQKKAIYRQERALSVVDWSELDAVSEWLRDVLDYLRESNADTEHELAAVLLEDGPLEVDGRLYEHWHEHSTGLDRVNVRNVEPEPATGIQNRPESMD